MAEADDDKTIRVNYSRLRDRVLKTSLKFRLETDEWVYEEHDLE